MKRPIIFWIATLAAVIAAVTLLREVLLPFVAGMVLAYLLNPLAGRIERLGVNRLLATLGIMTVAVVVIVSLLVLTIPTIVRELSYFIESVPLYVKRLQTLANDPSRPWLSKLVGEGLGETERSLGELTALASHWAGTVLHSIWSGGQALLSFFSLAVVTPIVACYLIFDWNRMLTVIDRWVPPARRTTVRALAAQIDGTIAGYVRGQSVLCLVLAAFYAAALTLIGLKHGALIGISAGLLSFIPYLGSLTGLVISVAIAIAQFWPNWTPAILVLAVFFVGQSLADYVLAPFLIGVASGLLSFIPYLGSLSGLVISICVAIAQFWPDWRPVFVVLAVFFVGQSLADYVLAPYLVGRRMHLNPVWMMFALFAFGYLFGFVGLLIAGPLAAAIGVLVRFALRQYYASPLYAGSGPAASLHEISGSGVPAEEPRRSAAHETTPFEKAGIVAR